jgi:hypothetical protein
MGTITHVGAVIGVILAAIALATILARWARSVYRWIRAQERRLEYIDGELRHNGGETMRDMIAHHGETLEAICESQGQQDERLNRHSEAMRKIQAHLEAWYAQNVDQ